MPIIPAGAGSTPHLHLDMPKDINNPRGRGQYAALAVFLDTEGGLTGVSWQSGKAQSYPQYGRQSADGP